MKAPEGIEEEKLQKVLHKKAPWILEKWEELNEIAAPPAPKDFISGEEFPYLGRHYRLKVYKKKLAKAKLLFQNGRFFAEIPETTGEVDQKQQLYRLFRQWYIEHGTEKIKKRIAFYEPKIMESPLKVTLK